MKRAISSRLVAPLLCGLAAAAMASAETPSAGRSEPVTRAATILTVLEGPVLELTETSAEGEMAVVVARVQAAAGQRLVLLAPRSVLAEAGFELEVGDRLRARVFAEAAGNRVYSQKIMNLTRRRLLRVRTLRHEPLWDLTGRWQSLTDGTTPSRQRVHRRPPRRRRQPPRRPPRRPARSRPDR